MKYYSTGNKNIVATFKDAILKGISDDGGLFMPEEIPIISENFYKNIENMSFQEIAFEVAKPFCINEISENALFNIINEAINFSAPLKYLDDNIQILELFHGPTLAFKDFGARFTAKTMSHFLQQENKEINILVATSGDTGSAVANGFYNVPGIKVTILYPSNKVSYLQEKQLTTLGGNITALEIDGTFDDCQNLVKQAFVDKEIINKINLSSANSINIGRLLPQSFYYFNAYKQIKDKSKQLVFCVPSGNLGNITAGLFAFKMGLPVNGFIAAHNANDVFTNYIKTGNMNTRPSVLTLSNAMDVGNPSNAARIFDMFNNDYSKISKLIKSESVSDEETKIGIVEVKNKYNYIIDPHGAVGYMAVKKIYGENIKDRNIIILETAHPAKFSSIIEEELKITIDLPVQLKDALEKDKVSVKLSNNYNEFKSYLLK